MKLTIHSLSHFELSPGITQKNLLSMKVTLQLEHRQLNFFNKEKKLANLKIDRSVRIYLEEEELRVLIKKDGEETSLFNLTGSKDHLKSAKQLLFRLNKNIKLKAPLEQDFHTTFEETIWYDKSRKTDYRGFLHLFYIFCILNLIRAFIASDMKKMFRFYENVL